MPTLRTATPTLTANGYMQKVLEIRPMHAAIRRMQQRKRLPNITQARAQAESARQKHLLRIPAQQASAARHAMQTPDARRRRSVPEQQARQKQEAATRQTHAAARTDSGQAIHAPNQRQAAARHAIQTQTARRRRGAAEQHIR